MAAKIRLPHFWNVFGVGVTAFLTPDNGILNEKILHVPSETVLILLQTMEHQIAPTSRTTYTAILFLLLTLERDENTCFMSPVETLLWSILALLHE